MADGLDIEQGPDGSYVIGGDLDAHSATRFESALGGVAGTVVLDLSGVDFADSSGLRVLLALHRRLEADGGQLVLGTVSARVERLLSLTGLDQVFSRA
ncbi:MAG: STAS domain-containing protein [Actinomycetota bacterium]